MPAGGRAVAARFGATAGATATSAADDAPSQAASLGKLYKKPSFL
jgi:hypothetical protein